MHHLDLTRPAAAAVIPAHARRILHTQLAFTAADIAEVDGIADTIATTGLVLPLVVAHGDRLLDGRKRLAALRQLGVLEVPVLVVSPGVPAPHSPVQAYAVRHALTLGVAPFPAPVPEERVPGETIARLIRYAGDPEVAAAVRSAACDAIADIDAGVPHALATETFERTCDRIADTGRPLGGLSPEPTHACPQKAGS